jgi:hypothetical protein
VRWAHHEDVCARYRPIFETRNRCCIRLEMPRREVIGILRRRQIAR